MIDMKSFALLAGSTMAHGGFYSPSLHTDHNGYTSYDYTYGASYSYDYLNSDAHKWDYSTGMFNTTYHSTWYSSTLHSDGSGTHTSYDYTYGNSYSYMPYSGDVAKWDYKTDTWNETGGTAYDADRGSTSPSLRSDGNGYTSYDYSYGASYSYDYLNSDTHKWDYSSSDWNATYHSTGTVHL